MKKVKSPVWRFFDRVEEDNRCVAVMCKLCDNQYKYFGNTTNLRVHLINKHPVQWELSESGNLDDNSLQEAVEAAEHTTRKSPRRIKLGKRLKKNLWEGTHENNVGYSVSVTDNNEDSTSGLLPKIEIQRVDVLDQNSDSDQDNTATINMVRQMHGEDNSEEEWLEDPYQITHIETYEPKPKRARKLKYRKIKREVQSPTGLPGYYVAPKHDKRLFEEPPSSKDEYGVFGEYVANKLRKLKNPRTIGNLQQLITTLLWQGEYGMYDNAEAVKRVLMISVADPEPETVVNNSDIVYEQMEAAVDNSVSQDHVIKLNSDHTQP